MIIPGLKDWFEDTFGASLHHKTLATVGSVIHFYSVASSVTGIITGVFFVVSQPILSSSAVPPPTQNEAFVEEMKSTGIPVSHEAEDRVFRGHGEPLPTKTTHQVTVQIFSFDTFSFYSLPAFGSRPLPP